jgi:hypothetical protein
MSRLKTPANRRIRVDRPLTGTLLPPRHPEPGWARNRGTVAQRNRQLVEGRTPSSHTSKCRSGACRGRRATVRYQQPLSLAQPPARSADRVEPALSERTRTDVHGRCIRYRHAITPSRRVRVRRDARVHEGPSLGRVLALARAPLAVTPRTGRASCRSGRARALAPKVGARAANAAAERHVVARRLTDMQRR